MVVASKEMQEYFSKLRKELDKAYEIANKARALGFDPETKVDIPIAENMAERVEGLISASAPQLIGSGLINRIKELEKEYGILDWRVALKIAEEVSKEKFCKFKDKKEAMEVGIRVGFAYITLGIVSAPLEGFIGIEIKKRKDNKEYVAAKFAGPIRGAGGTAAAVCVIITDYVRIMNGFDAYDATDDEAKRYYTELEDYHNRVTTLQYHPSEREVLFLLKNLPVEVDGEPSEKIEVSNYKDLPRISTNKIRGGMCLVLSMIALKAPKLYKRLGQWGKDFNLNWDFIEEFLKIQKEVKAKKGKTEKTSNENKESKKESKSQEDIQKNKEKEENKILPNYTYISEIVAGRPVFSMPMNKFGFRLRFGRTRTSGFSAASIHPSTQIAVKGFIATGTQLKVERPGKAAGMTICDHIEPPIVRLNNKSVIKLDDLEFAKKNSKNIEKIIYLGDILFNYGDFSENGHILIPVGYNEEQWFLELEEIINRKTNNHNNDNKNKDNNDNKDNNKKNTNIINKEKLKNKEIIENNEKRYKEIVNNEIKLLLEYIKEDKQFNIINFSKSYELNKKFGVALHPEFTFYYHTINFKDYIKINKILKNSKIIFNKHISFPTKVDSIEKRFNRFIRNKDINKDKKTRTKENNLELKNIYTNIISNKEYSFLDNFILVVDDFDERHILEKLGIQFDFVNNKIIIPKMYSSALLFQMNFDFNKFVNDLSIIYEEIKSKDIFYESMNKIKLKDYFLDFNELNKKERVIDFINKDYLKIKDKSGSYIGARMGRPEKAKMRKLKGSPHVLFPVSEQGGRLRSFQSCLEQGYVEAEFPIYFCEKCQRQTIFSVCEVCGSKTKKMYYCNKCGIIHEKCEHDPKPYKYQKIDIRKIFNNIKKQIGINQIPTLIKGVRGTTNKDKIPEHLAKGILRAKHNIYVNKDGTTRYDMSELPITHFKPKEIGTSIEKLKELGYLFDIYGKPLENENQILELKPQDIILPTKSSLEDSADQVLFNVANFVDELLEKFYKLPKFYNLKKTEDLVGHLVIGLAPHISAGMLGRIIGFSNVQACYAHPLWHAGLRRDCDGDENCVILLMDALLNFSRQYLPDKRGSRTMDAPLVLTAVLDPAEVDDMAHGIDVVNEYPLEFYEKANNYASTKEIKLDTIGRRLGTELQYEKMMFTHDTTNINDGLIHCSYKLINDMSEKINQEMELSEQIEAVDENYVANLIVDKHFIRDIKGNLRKFSKQTFRCLNCNEKYRRPPLGGRCLKCNGKIGFTISQGFILKYLQPSIDLVNKYKVDPFLRQSIILTKKRIEDIFGKVASKQENLNKWFG